MNIMKTLNIEKLYCEIEDYNKLFLEEKTDDNMSLSMIFFNITFVYIDNSYSFYLQVSNTFDIDSVSTDLKLNKDDLNYDEFVDSIIKKENVSKDEAKEMTDLLFQEIIEKNNLQTQFDNYIESNYIVEEKLNKMDHRSLNPNIISK